MLKVRPQAKAKNLCYLWNLCDQKKGVSEKFS